MNPSKWSRTLSLLLAGFVTMSVLAGIDQLATPEPAASTEIAARSAARA